MASEAVIASTHLDRMGTQSTGVFMVLEIIISIAIYMYLVSFVCFRVRKDYKWGIPASILFSLLGPISATLVLMGVVKPKNRRRR